MDLSKINNCYVGATQASGICIGPYIVWPKYIQYTDNGATYCVEAPTQTYGAVLGHSPYLNPNTGLPINDQYSGPISQPTPFINACDIILDITYRGITIYTMADLIKHISNIYNSLQ